MMLFLIGVAVGLVLGLVLAVILARGVTVWWVKEESSI